MSTKLISKSMIDGRTLLEGSHTDGDQIHQIMRRSRLAFDSWRRVPLTDRIAIVRRFAALIETRRDEITSLISHEVGKLAWDAAGEVGAAIAKAELSITAMEKRRGDTTIAGDPSSKNPIDRQIRYHPIGVCVVLGPFNFPLHLPGGQIIPALLAGNTVVFKPSEQATAVGQWMTNTWADAGLPADVMQMIFGDGQTAKQIIDDAAVAGVFLTGGRAAGHAIHRQLAGRPEVLLALELGGNNPIVVDQTADPEVAADLVSFSAFVSAGQRCTCARRAIFSIGASGQRQIDRLILKTQSLNVGMPTASPSQEKPSDDAIEVGPLISARAVQSLNRTYDELIDLGCKPLIAWKSDNRNLPLVHPVVLDATDINDDAKRTLGDMEWFGPLLVVQRAVDFDQAIDLASATPYGLAAALIGGQREQFDRFVDRIGAGGVNWNGPTTGAAGVLPFGGLGASGNHRPAGAFAIDFCSDPVASLVRPSAANSDPWESIHGK